MSNECEAKRGKARRGREGREGGIKGPHCDPQAPNLGAGQLLLEHPHCRAFSRSRIASKRNHIALIIRNRVSDHGLDLLSDFVEVLGSSIYRRGHAGVRRRKVQLPSFVCAVESLGDREIVLPVSFTQPLSFGPRGLLKSFAVPELADDGLGYVHILQHLACDGHGLLNLKSLKP